jgi:glycosyltransferase involved in cell wall biosynthesis
MFVIDEPTYDYSDPWDIPFEERFRSLCDGMRRVAYFYERPDTSTFRYRVYNMIQVLREFGDGIGAGFFGNDDHEHLARVVDVADVIVVCRAGYNQHINEMITRAKAKGKRVIFDVDDLVFNTDYVHLILRTLDQSLETVEAWNHWFGFIGRIGATLRMCDAAIATNAYLAEKISEYSGLPSSVIPNFLDREQLEISDRIFEAKARSDFRRNGEIHIGYFSGTPTHNHDFAIVNSALATVLEEDARVRIVVVGFLELKGGLERFADRIIFYPLHDFINLQRLMSMVEINIVPLMDNGFTNCKSELKYFEAAAVGTLTIATPIHSYASCIENGENGYLSTATQWLTSIRTLIKRLDDYPAMAARAHAHAMSKYAWFHQLPVIERVIFGEDQSKKRVTADNVAVG